VSDGARVALEEEEIDASTVVLSVRGEARALDQELLVERVTTSTADRVVLDLGAARHAELGLGEALDRCAKAFAGHGRRLVVSSDDADLRQALGLAPGEIELAASREEALSRLDSPTA
jgi:hypothetical protein